MEEFLKLLYGKDTRSVRTFNFAIHVIWVYLILVHLSNLSAVYLPTNIVDNHALILGLAITTVIVTLGSFIESDEWKLKVKYMSLTLGGFTQSIIAIQYIRIFPPLSIMVIVCTALALWFIGGALYIKYAYERDVE